MHLRHSLRFIGIALATASLTSLSARGQSPTIGQFDAHGDIGAPKIAGTAATTPPFTSSKLNF